MPPSMQGDVNMDGDVDFLDIGPFIVVLSSGMFQVEADTNNDGDVNFLDISPFIAILSGNVIPDDSPLVGVPSEFAFNLDAEIDNVLAIVKNSWLSENPNYEYFLAIDIVGSLVMHLGFTALNLLPFKTPWFLMVTMKYRW